MLTKLQAEQLKQKLLNETAQAEAKVQAAEEYFVSVDNEIREAEQAIVNANVNGVEGIAEEIIKVNAHRAAIPILRRKKNGAADALQSARGKLQQMKNRQYNQWLKLGERQSVVDRLKEKQEQLQKELSSVSTQIEELSKEL